MRGTNALPLCVMSLLVSACTITSPSLGYGLVSATGPLQPDNCGTPYQFKDCRSGPHVDAVRPLRPEVVIEELTGPAVDAPAPGPQDLINYSRLSVPGHAPLTPALGEPAPEPDK